MTSANSITRTVTLIFFLYLGPSVTAKPGDANLACQHVAPLVFPPRTDDTRKEEAFCAIDINSPSVALCPKTWSTSPGALIYDLKGTDWENRAPEFEKEVCKIGGHARDKARSELAIFKNSLNGRKTSGTFAPSSILYYHFSRLLQTRIEVPVAVMVELPAKRYRDLVVSPGLVDSQSGNTGMLHAGWVEMAQALDKPGAYTHRREMFSANNDNLWGILLLGEGRRYGPEVNGTRASGWGEGQNRDFQQTAPFRALREDRPLAEAISAGLTSAGKDAEMARHLDDTITHSQVAWWMNEITELVILDVILKQQDRIGNIDYRWRWLWLEDGSLKSSMEKPGNPGALRLRTSILNDNDAGVRSGYANYALRTDMLSGWHHLDPQLYERVQSLAADLRDEGPIASAIRNNYRLSEREAQGIIDRGIEVAAKLQSDCENKTLRFDLHLDAVMAPEHAEEQDIDCLTDPGKVDSGGTQ